MMTRKPVLLGSAAILLFFSLVSSAHAQIPQYIPFTGPQGSLAVTLSPQQPAPGEDVVLSVTSANVDLDRSDITWRVDGKTISSASSEKTLTLTAPPLGKVTTVTISARNATADANTTVRITPVDIDILWSTDSYTPPFYKGRTLPGSLSTIRAYALVRFKKSDGLFVSEKDIVFTWYRNGAALSNVSGRGRSSINLPGPQLFGSDSVELRAESLDRSFIGSASVHIPALDTKLLLYENHPLFGILYHRAIAGEVNTSEREQKITVVPFFAHLSSPENPALEYEWSVNGERVEANPSEPQTLTIDATNFSGPAEVTLSLTSFSDITMRADAAWKFVFGESTNAFFNPLFGN